MSSRFLLLCALVVPVAVASASPSQTPAHPHPHHHGHAQAQPHDHADATARPGLRWQADAPSRAGIQQIRNARPGEPSALAAAIDEAIAHMIRHCRLPADADAALHGVLGQLGQAADQLRGDSDPAVGRANVDAALARYAELFDEADPAVEPGHDHR